MSPKHGKNIGRLAGAALLAAVAVGPARADYPGTVLSHNPLAYWQFNETTASPAPYKLANSGSVGSAGDAYAIPSVTNGVAGVAGNAVLFSNPTGTAHAGSRVEVVYNPGLNPAVFSIEFWAQPSAVTLSTTFFDATGSCPISNFNPNNFGASRVGWLFYLAPTGKWNFRMGLTSGYAVNIVGGTGLATANTWQHIVATYDGSVVNLYANGVLIGSQTSVATSTGWVPNNGSFLRFGATPLNGDESLLYTDSASGNQYILPFNESINTAGNRGWDGLLDEVAIYTNALSAATVAAHYAAAATPATYGATILADKPVGYWNFDEPAVTRPDPSTFPLAANAGSLGSDADGTNVWGAVAAQPGPAYTGFPAGNKAVAFDGLNGSFSVKDAAGLHFTGNITLAAWVKPTARDGLRDIISHGLDDSGSETFLRVTRGDSYGTGCFYEVGACDGFSGEFYDSVQFPIPAGDLGNWVFLVGTFDGSNWNLYRNGVLAGTTPAYVSGTDQDTGALDVTNTWTIGSRALPSAEDGFRFAGSIDEPAIFNTALSAADIAALYSAAQVPPVITAGLQNPGTVFKGSTVSFSVFADGSPTLAYSWTSNGVPTGVTTTNYAISNIPVGDYTVGVIVSNAYGTNTSAVSFSVMAAPPTITTAPAPETRFVGYPFSFSVVAAGSAPLTYTWQLGDTVVQTGASPTYGGTASLANAGNYVVIVSNETGINATSAPVALTVNPVPAGYGSVVIASKPIAYWRLDEAPGSTVAHDGIGGNDGTYNNVTLGVPGYSVNDTDTAASFTGLNTYVGGISGTAINFTGSSATFTVEAWVNAQAGLPDESTIIAKGIGASGTTRSEQFALDVYGGNYRFFSTYNGTLYEADGLTGPDGSWQHVVGIYDGQNILGQGTNVYIFVNGVQEGFASAPAKGPSPITTPVSIGSKRTGNDPGYNGTFVGTVDEVAVYDYVLDATTIEAHYDALYGSTTAPFISVQPSPTTNYVGLPATLRVIAAGSVPISYQWHKGNVDVGTGNTLTIPALAASDAGDYSVTVSNGLGSTNSTAAHLTVLGPPTSPPSIPGLVVHLPFDNSLTDATGRGNDGANVNGATFVPDGVLGAALHYSTDSTNTADIHYVTLGVRPDLSFSSNVSFSVAFWIRLPVNYQGGDLPFFTDTTNSTFGKGFVFAPTYGFFATASPASSTAVDGGWAFSVFSDAGTTGIGGHGPVGSINDGGWHHLVYVMDRTAGSLTYLDGVVSPFTLQQGATLSAAGDIDTGAPATIGQDPSGHYGEIGSGDIDDLGVWRRALTPLEAASIYVAGSSSKLSFVGAAPVVMTIGTTTNSLVTLTWPGAGGVLQSAGQVQGPFTDITGAVSPYTVNPVGTTNQFYRVKF